MKHIFSCAIVDDEPHAIEFLADKLAELYDNLIITGTYGNWKDALPALRNEDLDLLFLDISMPQKNGFNLLSLVPQLKAEIIFVTAYSEYALTAFDFSATGYILKPIKDAVLTKTVDKALERRLNKKLLREPAQPEGGSKGANLKIGIPNSKGLDYINTEDILYLEATRRYTRIVEKGRETLSSYNIGKFWPLLEPHLFYKVHRSFIVNLNYVNRYESVGIITLSNNKKIPVSKNVRDNFLSIFDRIGKTI